MKLCKTIHWILALVLLMTGTSCFKDSFTKTYAIMTPVVKDKAEVLAQIGGSSPAVIANPGKIYSYGQYIFLNEVDKGVHIIDNQDPSHPVNKAFINIPGNLDIAVKGHTLYADLFTDLLAIDITDPLQAKFSKLIPHVFPERIYSNNWTPLTDSTKVIIGWNHHDTTVTVDPQVNDFNCRGCLFSASNAMPAAQTTKTASGGVAGSMARFSIIDNYLYAVNNYLLYAINIDQPLEPKIDNTVSAGWLIETIYPFKDKLFLGSSVGMNIFSITDPKTPKWISSFRHASACDPVVTDGTNAYITLRTGTFCMGTSNQLDVVDVSNLNSPSLLKTYPMTQPAGLAKDGDYLFICDGKDGLKVYDAKDPKNISLMHHIKGFEAYDVITLQGVLLVVTKSGLLQYNYTNMNNLKLLSQLNINTP